MAKIWYNVTVECIGYHPGLSMRIGQRDTVVKVKSKGLAYSIARHLEENIYKADCFKVTIE